MLQRYRQILFQVWHLSEMQMFIYLELCNTFCFQCDTILEETTSISHAHLEILQLISMTDIEKYALFTLPL